MSEFTEQITEACGKIAENQRKLYDKGYADGRASVKHICFYVYHYNELIAELCAFEGMTWRDWIASDMNPGNFVIRDELIRNGDYYVDAKPDDVIVEKGIYNVSLYDLSDPDIATINFCEGVALITIPAGMTWAEFIGSEYDETGGLFYIEDGIVKNWYGTGAVLYSDTGEEVKSTDVMLSGNYSTRF